MLNRFAHYLSALGMVTAGLLAMSAFFGAIGVGAVYVVVWVAV